MNGFDGMRMVKTHSMEESIVMGAASRRAAELREEEQKNLAMMIRNEIADAWNKGQK